MCLHVLEKNQKTATEAAQHWFGTEWMSMACAQLPDLGTHARHRSRFTQRMADEQLDIDNVGSVPEVSEQTRPNPLMTCVSVCLGRGFGIYPT